MITAGQWTEPPKSIMFHVFEKYRKEAVRRKISKSFTANTDVIIQDYINYISNILMKLGFRKQDATKRATRIFKDQVGNRKSIRL